MRHWLLNMTTRLCLRSTAFASGLLQLPPEPYQSRAAARGAARPALPPLMSLLKLMSQ